MDRDVIDIFRRLNGTNTAYVMYQDRPHTVATLEANTVALAAERNILPLLAQKALTLLFPWDYLP